jgi:hypothetical protein
LGGGDYGATHDSSDLDSFVDEFGAICCARAWAIWWIDENWD